MEMLLQIARKILNYTLQYLGLVVFRFGVDGEGLQRFQTRLEGVMLIDVGYQETWLVHDLLEGWKHEGLFKMVIWLTQSVHDLTKNRKSEMSPVSCTLGA